jgi:hypothetical protein
VWRLDPIYRGVFFAHPIYSLYIGYSYIGYIIVRLPLVTMTRRCLCWKPRVICYLLNPAQAATKSQREIHVGNLVPGAVSEAILAQVRLLTCV